VLASPWARRRADELGVDLATVVGSGPGGAVAGRDVERVGPQLVAAAVDSDATRRQAMRRAIGDLMARSAREIPHYHVSSTIDLEATMTRLADANERRPVAARILPAAVLLTATARAAVQCPSMNGTWVDGFRPTDAVHLGVAVALRGGGLATPTIHDAHLLSLDEMMAALTDTVARARAGRLRTSDVADGTITVTNLGERGAEEVHGIIYPPQVALVGFGRILERPWVTGGVIVPRRTVRVTVTADHRASDGHDGSRLLDTIDHLLQRPEAFDERP
jgi:pyruvate dehydrogenase E2 component (dihydrolipoamide acetyltransferase)